MKALKILVVFSAACAVLLGAGAAYLLATFDAARVKQEVEAAVLKQTGRTLKIEGDLALAFWPNVAVKIGRTTLSGAGGTGEFARLESASFSVAALPLLAQRLAVREADIVGLAATVVKNKDGTLSIADLLGAKQADAKVGAGGTASGTPPDLDVAAIRIANARFDWRDEQAGGAFSLADFDLSSGAIRLANGAGNIENLALAAQAKFPDGNAAVKLSAPVTLDLSKRTLALPRFAGQFELAHAGLPMKKLMLPLAGEASLDLAKQSAALRLETKLDDSTLKLKLDIGKFAPLALAFDLDIDTLDVDRYLPQERKPASGDGRIDLAALKGLNLKGAARIGQLKVANLKASEIRASVAAQNGRVVLAPFAAKLYEGQVEGSLSADANGNRFAAQQNLTHVRLGALLKDAAHQDMLDGRGSVALDIATQGDTVPALKKALGGTARIALADGALKGLDIGGKLRELRGMLKGGSNVDAAHDATQKTDFSELTASFRIAGGVARNDDLAAKSPLLRLAGAGDIDIGESRLDYLLKPTLVATSKGQGGDEADSLRGLTVPVRLTGPFAQPAWKFELSGLAGDAAKAKVAEKKEELKQKVGDATKDKLKGLFGR